jgi:hypothetical protein
MLWWPSYIKMSIWKWNKHSSKVTEFTMTVVSVQTNDNNFSIALLLKLAF